jgi:carotenoid 1,2-hydratase
VAPGGYAWWYLDALSDDGEHGITIIAFLGSVFSPYYAWARRRAAGGAADPLAHCAINVALYRRSARIGRRWCMTERGRGTVVRSSDGLQIGPSLIERQGETLTFCLDEVSAPWPSRLHGMVRLHAGAWADHGVALDTAGRHRWSVLAPCARVEVDLSAPALRWSGPGYLDSNQGQAPLEADFIGWNWSRARLDDAQTAVVYDVLRRDGTPLSIAQAFDAGGASQAFTAPAEAALPTSAWRLARSCRSDIGTTARVAQSLEDGPFYNRSVVEATWAQRPVHAIHESLSLDRFDARWVQALLPFRMPRRAG